MQFQYRIMQFRHDFGHSIPESVLSSDLLLNVVISTMILQKFLTIGK